MHGSMRSPVLTTLALVAFLSPFAVAEDRCPDSPAMSTLTGQNGYRGGQQTDLKIEVTDIDWITTPCPDPSKQILEKLRVEITLSWITAISYFGKPGLQAEGSDTVRGNDLFSLQWGSGRNYQLSALLRNGVDIYPPAGGGESVLGGSGTWNGVKLTVPTAFENGTAPTLVYTFEWQYTFAPGDNCRVAILPYRGHYIHSYDGDVHTVFSATPELTVSAGYPWTASVSASATISFGNNHCWTKYMVNPTGTTHLDNWVPPANVEPDVSCCPIVTPPDNDNPSGDFDSNNPSSTSRGSSDSMSYEVSDATSGVKVVEMTVEAPDGTLIAQETTTFASACAGPCLALVSFTVPDVYQGDSVVCNVTALDSAGNALVDSTVLPVADPLGPNLESAMTTSLGLPKGRLLCPDTLEITINEYSAGATATDVMNRVTAYVVSAAGTITDTETGIAFAPLGGAQFVGSIPVQSTGTVQAADGVLTVESGQVVDVVYADTDTPHLSRSIPVICEALAVVPDVESLEGTHALAFRGSGTGGNVSFRIDGVTVSTPAANGESAASVASGFVSAVNAAGISGVTATLFSGIHVTLSGSGPIHPLELDPGIWLEPTGSEMGVSYCSPAVPNSAGTPAVIRASGTTSIGDNFVLLECTDMPINKFGYFITARTQGFIMNPGGSQGNLCVGAPFGRFNALIQSSGVSGSFSIQVPDLMNIPLLGAVLSGETWNFQTWYRDNNPTSTSNFSDATTIVFI